jgi:hypothetical protein
VKWRRRESNRADGVLQTTEIASDELPTPGNNGNPSSRSMTTGDEDGERGALDCTNCTKEYEHLAAGPAVDPQNRSAESVPNVESGLFLIAGARVAAVHGGNSRLLRARAELQDAVVEAAGSHCEG